MRTALIASLAVAATLAIAATATGRSTAPGATVASAGIPGCEKGKLGLLDSSGATLTIGADNPAYPPWYGGAEKTKPWKVSDPYSGKGYEDAVAYRIAALLGFAKADVKWAVVPFNNSYRPGKKPFDVGQKAMQQAFSFPWSSRKSPVTRWTTAIAICIVETCWRMPSAVPSHTCRNRYSCCVLRRAIAWFA